MKLSQRLNGIAESSTLKMNAIARDMAARGVDVINLTAGEPDFPILDPIKEAAIAAVKSDFSKYTPVPGTLDLRKALSKKFEKDNALTYAPEHIVVSSGAKQAIFNFLLATIDPGDEVIIPAPYWVSYPEMVRIAGGVPVILQTRQEDGFKVTGAQVKKALTPRTKAFILNSPSNPTGSLYSKEQLTDLASALVGSSVWVVSDEIYEKILYEGKFHSFAALSQDAFNRTVTVNGFSKAYAMTGWRLGYATGPKEVIAAMSMLQGQSTSGANSVTQKAAVVALQQPDQALAPMVQAFRRRRDRMVEIFSKSEFCSFSIPEGAFYFFLNINGLKGLKNYKGSEAFAFHLLDHAQVVTVPGDGFGADNYIRLSFAVSDQAVELGSTRIVETLSKY